MFLLMPSLASGSFSNGFVVTKDSGASYGWGDGGGDAFDVFDSTVRVGRSMHPNIFQVGLGNQAGADGDILTKTEVDGVITSAGWVVPGIWAIKYALPTPSYYGVASFKFRAGYPGDAYGVTTKDFVKNGRSYRLYTFWTATTAQDQWASRLQITVTFVGMLGDHNKAAGSYLRYWRGAEGSYDNMTKVDLTHFQYGVSCYIQWGKATVSDVQDYIIGDLVESEVADSFTPLNPSYPSNVESGSIYLPLKRFPGITGVLPNSVGAPTPRLIDGKLGKLSQDTRGWGTGKIAGVVEIDSSPDYPVARKVVLCRKSDMMVWKSTWSDPITGDYLFSHLPLNVMFVVMAFDYTGAYNAVIEDNMVPVSEITA